MIRLGSPDIDTGQASALHVAKCLFPAANIICMVMAYMHAEDVMSALARGHRVHGSSDSKHDALQRPRCTKARGRCLNN